jgi:hypothetical protein
MKVCWVFVTRGVSLGVIPLNKDEKRRRADIGVSDAPCESRRMGDSSQLLLEALNGI